MAEANPKIGAVVWTNEVSSQADERKAIFGEANGATDRVNIVEDFCRLWTGGLRNSAQLSAVSSVQKPRRLVEQARKFSAIDLSRAASLVT